MDNTSEDTYQIATLVVIVLTALVVIAYLLIFINPRIALNPLKPPLPVTPTVAVAALPALPPTWTPTPTDTATTTPTPTSTSTPTFTATPTNAPTAIPSATPRPPTRTPAPAPPAPPGPQYAYRAVLQSCTHSGGTFIKGKVTSGGQPDEGVRVRVGTSPDPAAVIEEQIAHNQGDGNASYAFTLRTLGAFDTPSIWYVWVIDGVGNPASDPNFHVTTNNLPADDPAACWLAIVDFAK